MKISNHRVEEIITFIKGLSLDQKFQKEFTKEKIKNILYINESLLIVQQIVRLIMKILNFLETQF